MNRRSLFKGIAALAGGAVAAKLGVRATHYLGAVERDSAVVLVDHDPDAPRFDMVPHNQPLFDLVDIGTTSDGKRLQVPRWRGSNKLVVWLAEGAKP